MLFIILFAYGRSRKKDKYLSFPHILALVTNKDLGPEDLWLPLLPAQNLKIVKCQHYGCGGWGMEVVDEEWKSVGLGLGLRGAWCCELSSLWPGKQMGVWWRYRDPPHLGRWHCVVGEQAKDILERCQDSWRGNSYLVHPDPLGPGGGNLNTWQKPAEPFGFYVLPLQSASDHGDQRPGGSHLWPGLKKIAWILE